MTERQEPATNELDRARAAAADAYTRARRDVYDQFPAGRLDPDELTQEQQATLRRLEQAEAELADLRRSRVEDAGSGTAGA